MPQVSKTTNINNIDFEGIAVSVASPEDILSWSYGEVVKPETINYRTQKPERGGLFCEKIFGPTKNWECYCGKYKRIRYKGVICEKCGVEVTRSVVRRERQGHISLAVPITHIWYLRSTPSRLGLLLDLPVKQIEQVVYFAAYIITEVDDTAREAALAELKNEYVNYKKKLQTDHQKKLNELNALKHDAKKDKEAKQVDKDIKAAELEFNKKLEELEDSNAKVVDQLRSLSVGSVISEIIYRDLAMKFGHVFKAAIGSEAIRNIIASTDFEKFINDRKEELKKASGQKQKKIMKRLKLVTSLQRNNIRPEWMIMTVLPVIPPDLRPMVQLDGGRFAASDLNDLYRRVINRNNRLKKLLEIGAPEVICRNEKRMLQEAVDTLLNSDARVSKTTFNVNERRKLRSLSDMLKGKQGRFRQNLLGKRVDYSGRSVIVVGPELKLHQCGIPKEMALKLFKPFVIGRLIRDGLAYNVKNGEKVIASNRKEVWDILEDVTKNYYVLLNRAPTLHRLGIQAFQPKLIEGKAIQVHPLVCSAFNADFDGDQMAVHIPLSDKAQYEAQNIMVSAHNLLKPSSGDPVITPSQDMIWGSYYLTRMRSGTGEDWTDKEIMKAYAEGKVMVFSNEDEVLKHYQEGKIGLQEMIFARVKTEYQQENDEFFPVRWEVLKTTVGRIMFNQAVVPAELGYVNQLMNKKELSKLVSRVYERLGREKTVIMADKIKALGFRFATESGMSIGHDDMKVPVEKSEIIARSDELVKAIQNKWYKGFITADERRRLSVEIWNSTKKEIEKCMKAVFHEDNHIIYMVNSGARGNWVQVSQLCAMKGLVSDPTGRTIELPIKSSLKEGFSISEYFNATHAGRKGKSDTALKTAEAGYLTRRLVDSVQDVIVKAEDCGTQICIEVSHQESEEIGEDFSRRIFGRTLAKDVVTDDGQLLVPSQSIVTESVLEMIEDNKVDRVWVYSVLNCRVENGVCKKCYGYDLGHNEAVKTGTPVGIIAAQSIGEPGTQLTMRTFHTGGIATEGMDMTQGLERVEELFEARSPKTPAIMAEISGKVTLDTKKDHIEITVAADGLGHDEYLIPYEYEIKVRPGDEIKDKQVLAKSSEDKTMIRSRGDGRVKEILDDRIIVEHSTYQVRSYRVPPSMSLLIKKGDHVTAGQPLTIGHLDLRRLLELRGLEAVQKYITHEVQSIYSSQGQSINDKHIEIIVKQMFSKVRIINVGDTSFLPGEITNVIRFEEENVAAEAKNGKKATGERLLLGLTKIALYTDSWLSAASFQETIRVLVEASITKRVDLLKGLKENVIIGRLIPAGNIYRREVRDKDYEEYKIARHPETTIARPAAAPLLPPEEGENEY